MQLICTKKRVALLHLSVFVFKGLVLGDLTYDVAVTAIKATKIKAVSYHCIPTRMARVQRFLEDNWQFLTKLNTFSL